MRDIIINKKKLKIYDSIDELPIIRFHKYNKYYLIDTCLGSDISDIDYHIRRSIGYINTNKDLAITELENLRRALHLINQTINAKHMAYAVLVAEIDGEKRDDLSDEGIKKTLEMLNDIPKGWIDRLIESVKKKIDDEISAYFPSQFDDARHKEALEYVHRRTGIILDGIISENPNTNAIRDIDNYLLTFLTPKKFYGNNNAEIAYDKQFGEMNILLSNELGLDYKTMSVLEYYTSFEYLKKLRKK